jgi:hypothetical protein
MKVSFPQKQLVSLLSRQLVRNNQVFKHLGRTSGHPAGLEDAGGEEVVLLETGPAGDELEGLETSTEEEIDEVEDPEVGDDAGGAELEEPEEEDHE